MKKKKYGSKTGKVSKGAPSGVIISLVFHGVVFAAAGIFVVFKVLEPPKPAFVPKPAPQRPTMDLKKPQVKVRKSSSPKPANRIVATMKQAKMPEISIPDLVGTGEGLLGGMGGVGGDSFGMPGAGGTHLFGGKVTTGRDLEVRFYCLARNSRGASSSVVHEDYYQILADFVQKGWDTRLLSRYYCSPEKLYAKCVAIPIVSSILGPLAFGENDLDQMTYNARCWAAHYRGVLTHKDGITFRFWGASDDVLTVALDKEVVLAANFPWSGVNAYYIARDFDTTRAPGSRSAQDQDDGAYKIESNVSLVGSDWITLEPGEIYDFDAIVGEGPGGEFFAMLMVEVQGEEYEKNDRGNPIFPLFATEPLSWETQDGILMNMYDGDANVTNINTYFVVE